MLEDRPIVNYRLLMPYYDYPTSLDALRSENGLICRLYMDLINIGLSLKDCNKRNCIQAQDLAITLWKQSGKEQLPNSTNVAVCW